ncbi:MAG: hypothetical protein JJT89_12195 [Nitriliruptoraceae bacterium]|nr:hypothetical protein [Nitriliruptoraceae bacterium]
MSIDLDQVLDARPAWANRLRIRVYAWIQRDPRTRRRALAFATVAWQAGEWVAPQRQVAPIRAVLLAMVLLDSIATYVWVTTGLAVEGNPLVASVMDVFGDGVGLTLRTLWSAALVLALTWLAERRAMVRPALIPVLFGLGAVTLLHIGALSWVWTSLLW